MSNGQNGKGDSSRPLSISKKEFDKRWDKIFGKKDKKNKKKTWHWLNNSLLYKCWVNDKQTP